MRNTISKEKVLQKIDCMISQQIGKKMLISSSGARGKYNHIINELRLLFDWIEQW